MKPNKNEVLKIKLLILKEKRLFNYDTVIPYVQQLQARIAELETKQDMVLENPEKWMKWCDDKVLDWNEQLRKENEELKANGKPSIDKEKLMLLLEKWGISETLGLRHKIAQAIITGDIT